MASVAALLVNPESDDIEALLELSLRRTVFILLMYLPTLLLFSSGGVAPSGGELMAMVLI